jgi:predicted TIM-barrel fold metal-dependent hydrolase
LPNVVLKVGGFGMPIHGDDWHRDDAPLSSLVARRWGEEVRWCIELFGANRVMFESNSPVDRHLLGYTTIWNAFVLMTKSASESERMSLFHDTAARVYRVG